MTNSIDVIYGVATIIVLCITAYVAYSAPIKAVKIGRDLDDKQNKYLAKERLFLTLFAYRGSPLNSRFVDGLNQIDIVYRDTPAVLQAWHNHYRSLGNKEQSNLLDTWKTERLELISQMSIALGFGALNISAAMQHYYPEGHGEQEKKEEDLRDAATYFFQTGFVLNQKWIDSDYGVKPPKSKDEQTS